VSDFVDGSDLFTLWSQEKILDEDLVRLYVAEVALTLGKQLIDFISQSACIDIEQISYECEKSWHGHGIEEIFSANHITREHFSSN
jgi:hypothetical protein